MKRKNLTYGLIALILFVNVFLVNVSAAEYAENESGKKFKVIGYYSGDLFDEPLENLQTDKLTHVIYAFLIPQEDGSLIELKNPEKLRKLVEKCHAD